MPFTWICHISELYNILIRLIPQGTVDNNLGPDRLEGPNALDPNYCRQQTLWLHDLCLEVLTVHGTEFRLFGANAFPLLILLISIVLHIQVDGIKTRKSELPTRTRKNLKMIKNIGILTCHAFSFILIFLLLIIQWASITTIKA